MLVMWDLQQIVLATVKVESPHILAIIHFKEHI